MSKRRDDGIEESPFFPEMGLDLTDKTEVLVGRAERLGEVVEGCIARCEGRNVEPLPRAVDLSSCQSRDEPRLDERGLAAARRPDHGQKAALLTAQTKLHHRLMELPIATEEDGSVLLTECLEARVWGLSRGKRGIRFEIESGERFQQLLVGRTWMRAEVDVLHRHLDVRPDFAVVSSHLHRDDGHAEETGDGDLGEYPL